MKVDVILPAGGRLSGVFAEEAGAEVKALIPLGGRTVLERTIDVLRRSGLVGRIVLVGPDLLQGHPAASGADVVLPEGDSGPENIYRGLDWLHHTDGAHADRVLIVTTDLPFLTPEAVRDFLNNCPAEADICVPVLTREEFEARFAESPTMYVRLKEAEVTMACGFLVNPEAVAANRAHIDRLFLARKSEVAMARILGPLFVLRYLTRRLTVEQIRLRCQQIVGCSSAAVFNAPPEMAFDIDRPEEYRYALARTREAQMLS